MKKLSTWLLLIVLALLSQPGSADERILSFHSDITVHQDGSMTVTERITVRAEQRQIRRGIYRDFPTIYKDRIGNRYKVGFKILGVRRDGVAESYHTKQRSNGIRIYIGKRNYFLPKGQYVYTLRYRTSRQLGFFEKHDEIYWNVTGNGWIFPMDKASAAVTLPQAVPRDKIRTKAYTGRQGSTTQNYDANIDPDEGTAEFVTTRALGKFEGLTIVVGWPKGFVYEPTMADKMNYLLRDNKNIVYMLIGIIILIFYYLVVWIRYGRDLPAGTIIPLYYPEKGYTPAAMRFIRHRGYDHKAFATALVNMAVKGLIEIDENNDEFTINKKSDNTNIKLAAGEKAILKKLFGKTHGSIELVNDNHSKISSAITAHKKSLKRDYEKKYFTRNSGWVIPGVLMSIAVLLVGLFTGPVGIESAGGFMILIWIAGWSVGVYFLCVRAIKAWGNVGSIGGVSAAIGATIFAAVFLGFELVALFAFFTMVSTSVLAGLFTLIAVNTGFYHWLHADTRAGRRLLDKVDGFREYLNVAEGDELKMRGAPTKTADLFEMYLPYALALDVEQRWAERFASVFADMEQQDQHYQPGWYHGSHWHHDKLGSFANNLSGSLSSAISSSSTAPGSSSGGGFSSGGGSSGGGGGGGGGGGW